MEQKIFDVLIIGAGLSGIGAAIHLQKRCEGKSYAILEMRQDVGGTWDLFRYPGIRSDSDMHTLGYNFKPWLAEKAIADGAAILDYINEAADEHNVHAHIRFRHRVLEASWDTAESVWTVRVDTPVGSQTFRAKWLHMCSGYYRYDKGHMPNFAGQEKFTGDIIHPQHWPENLDYTDRVVTVIGSGATAMTLVPAMAKQAKHVTMLQRSPTYVASRPSIDAFANQARKFLPNQLVYSMVRWRNVAMQQIIYRMSRKRPEKLKKKLLEHVKGELPDGYPVERHFTPKYNPWDQRLCLVPDSDLFQAIRSKQASIVTDEIESFEANGIRVKSGDLLETDLIVTATGLELLFLGGIMISVDGKQMNPSEHLNYRSVMFSNVPNLTSVFGYTNASWTLRADLTSEYMCKLINYLDHENYVEARPVPYDVAASDNFMDFSSGYVSRAMDRFPKQAKEKPWVITQNYIQDVFLMRFGAIDDGHMTFRRADQTDLVEPSTEIFAE